MASLTKSTPTVREKDIQREWYVYDVKGKILGRCVTDISRKLIGKHKVLYSPHIDSGDYVVVINAKNVKLSGRKALQKIYTRYSGYPSGLREISYERLMQKDPRKIIEHAVSGMLPKNKLRSQGMRRLYVFPDNKHPYEGKLKVTHSS